MLDFNFSVGVSTESARLSLSIGYSVSYISLLSYVSSPN